MAGHSPSEHGTKPTPHWRGGRRGSQWPVMRRPLTRRAQRCGSGEGRKGRDKVGRIGPLEFVKKW